MASKTTSAAWLRHGRRTLIRVNSGPLRTPPEARAGSPLGFRSAEDRASCESEQSNGGCPTPSGQLPSRGVSVHGLALLPSLSGTAVTRDRAETARDSFFECPACGRHYARKPGKGLTFRWLHPISLALYDVIFDDHPARPETVSRNAESLLRQWTQDQIAAAIEEVRLELANPTQEVRDVLDCRATESELREFLRRLCDRLEAVPRSRHGQDTSVSRESTD